MYGKQVRFFLTYFVVGLFLGLTSVGDGFGEELAHTKIASATTEIQESLAFVHPGVTHSTEHIEFIKAKIAAGQQPWAEAWDRLKESHYARLDYTPNPWADVERGPSNDPNIGSSDFTRDGRAAYTHALQWILSGDEAHARKSAEIIDAWSSTLRSIGNHDARLLVGMSGLAYCNAAELLRHAWDGWPDSNQDNFRAMLRHVWYPVIKDFYPSANGNWDASMIQTMIAMGVFLDDRDMFDRAGNYFLEGKGNGAIGNYFNDFGQCQETGRDQTHTQMGLEFLANSCETAWIQGLDLYGAMDNRLLLGFEYTAEYNLGFDVRYEPYISFEHRYHYKKISDDSRGRLRPMYERVYRHYHQRLGLPAQYTGQAVLKVREKRRSRSRNVGSLPWDTLMYATDGESSTRNPG